MGNQNSKPTQITGVNVQGNLTANNVTSIIGYSSPLSTGGSTGPFRFNIPTPTRHFRGRRDTMKAVRDYFAKLQFQTSDCWERIAAIVGLGGMGKTETTYKFAAEYKEFFPNVAFINSETEETTLTSFLELAKYLGLVPQSTESANLHLVKEIYRQIDSRDCGRVLFIFDNAIQLNSNRTEFGILKYLPTEDLPNGRFPYILITTQTDYWERGIKRFQVNGLTEGQSLDFFRSSFQLNAPDCDEEIKKLHQILDGYPLLMNSVAAQIDYIPKKDSMHHLKQQLSNYIDKLGKDPNQMLTDNMSRACPSSYTKTLSNVFLMAFDRIRQENMGREALELLQMMSFLHVPIASDDVVKMLVHSSDCPHPPEKEFQFKVKELLRVLEKFYTVRILKEDDDEQYLFYDYEQEGFRCQLGIHRQLQFFARQQIDHSEVLPRVLKYFASDYECNKSVNKSALEEALRRNQVSQQALPYLGILACHGFPAACEIVKTGQPETNAAETIWRLYYLERGLTALNENATQVLHELIALTKSEAQLAERNFFRDITIRLLTDEKYFKHEGEDGTQAPAYFDLDSLGGMEQLVGQLMLNLSSVQDMSCKSYYCQRVRKSMDSLLSRLPARLPTTSIRADATNSTLTVDVIAETWFALLDKLNCYHSLRDKNLSNFLHNYRRDTHWAFHSPDASQSIIGNLQTSLRLRGRAKKSIKLCWSIFLSALPYSAAISSLSGILVLIISQSMNLKAFSGNRVQEVMSAICQMAATFETEFIYEDYLNVPGHCKDFALELCSFWVKLFLVDDNPPSRMLLEPLSRLKFLDWMERTPKDFFRLNARALPDEYRSEFFPKFIQRFSFSYIKQIQTLVNVCRRLMEDCELEENRTPAVTERKNCLTTN